MFWWTWRNYYLDRIGPTSPNNDVKVTKFEKLLENALNLSSCDYDRSKSIDVSEVDFLARSMFWLTIFQVLDVVDGIPMGLEILKLNSI